MKMVAYIKPRFALSSSKQFSQLRAEIIGYDSMMVPPPPLLSIMLMKLPIPLDCHGAGCVATIYCCGRGFIFERIAPKMLYSTG
jgi:hypothetical protein